MNKVNETYDIKVTKLMNKDKIEQENLLNLLTSKQISPQEFLKRQKQITKEYKDELKELNNEFKIEK